MHSPPRAARALLAILLPADVRASVVADLDDEFERHVASTRGALRARLWYYRQVAGSMGPAVTMRRRRRRQGVMRHTTHERAAWPEQALQDLRFTARSLRKRPGFTAAAIATLALGIGANTAIFSLVDGIVLRPLPYKDPDRLVRVWSNNPRGIPRNSMAPADFFDLRDQVQGPHGFASLSAFTDGDAAVLDHGSEPRRVVTSLVSPALFQQTLGVQAVAGRALGGSDADGDGAPVVVISDRAWRSLFQQRDDMVGQAIVLDDRTLTVVGIMPATFAFPSNEVGFWLPLAESMRSMPRAARFVQAVGHLAPDVTPERAHAVLRTAAARLETDHPATNKGWGITTTSLHDSIVGDVRRPLMVLLAAVGCVLLIACANVAGLLLANGARRTQEIAVRAALGAGRARIVRQQLVESAAIALAGGAAGLLLGWWSMQTLRGAGGFELPRMDEISLDLRVLGVTALLSVLTGLLAGTAPAFRAVRSDPHETLKSGRSAGGTPASRRSRSVLVTAQIALTLAVVVSAGLLLQTFARLTRTDAGFSADRVLVAQVNLPYARYAPRARAAFFERTLDQIRALPGVEVAGAGGPLPLSGQTGLYRFGVRFEGRPEPAAGQNARTYLRWATPGYFRAMGIAVLEGRVFSDADRVDTNPVAVVDEAFAARYFPGESPLGRRVRATNDKIFREIVGVVGSVRQATLKDAPEPHVYVAQAQSPSPAMTLVVRAAGDPSSLASPLREAVRRVDPALPVFNVRTLQSVVAGSVSAQRFNALLLALFAVVALALTAVGIYGLMSGRVSESTREIGVRIALGASRRRVLIHVLGESLRLAAAGAVLGLLLAVASVRFLAGLLYDVTATDPLTFGLATAVVFGAAIAASYLPARRALSIDPADSLRAD